MLHDALIGCAQAQIYLKQPQPDRYAQKPLILLVHGALGDHTHLLPWSQLWSKEFDVRLVDLPGHGRSEAPSSATFEAFVAEIGDLVARHLSSRQVIVIGESLGGLIALALGNRPSFNLTAVVALDPPFATAALWPVIDHLRLELNLQPRNTFLHDFALRIFGVSPHSDEAHDRLYYDVLKKLAVPTLVLAGDQPLGRRRRLAAVPSLITEVDRAVLHTLKSAQFKFEVFANTGHLIPATHPRESFETVRRFIESLPG